MYRSIKYTCLFISACLFLNLAPIQSAEVTPWKFMGSKDWRVLTGSSIKTDYAQTSVDDDKLSIFYAKDSRTWYIQFTYIDNRKLIHSDQKKPEIFVRTAEQNQSGRYDSDHLIQNKATVFYNQPGKPQYVIMPFEPKELRYIKVGLRIGVGYYVSSGCTEVLKGECLDLGEYRTYLFSGRQIENAISQIEKRNNLKITKPISQSQRNKQFKIQKGNEKMAQMLKWYQGDWAQVNRSGPMYNGCNTSREIDYDQFPNLMQKGRFLGYRFDGVLAISALGATTHDHFYISSGYPGLHNNGSLIIDLNAETKKIPLFTEETKEFYRIRLGAEIPGIPYKRIIDTDGKVLRFSAWDTKGKEVEPLFFIRCE